MKAALIPPIPELDEFGRGSFHLLLSHLVANKRYRDHYRKQRQHGAYLVLDNSAHESGIGERADTLLEQAVDLQAQEIVVPDQLDDCEGTIEGGLSAIENWYEHSPSTIKELDPALMYVPQGKDRDEWFICLRELVRLHVYAARKRGARRDFVLGISKDYEVWDGGLRALIEDYIHPLREDAWLRGFRISVHLLGWGRDLWKLDQLSTEYPWIRSTDSAKPFVYALRHIELIPNDGIPKYPGRRKNYFSSRFSQQQRAIAHHNVKAFKYVAGD